MKKSFFLYLFAFVVMTAGAQAAILYDVGADTGGGYGFHTDGYQSSQNLTYNSGTGQYCVNNITIKIMRNPPATNNINISIVTANATGGVGGYKSRTIAFNYTNMLLPLAAANYTFGFGNGSGVSLNDSTMYHIVFGGDAGEAGRIYFTNPGTYATLQYGDYMSAPGTWTPQGGGTNNVKFKLEGSNGTCAGAPSTPTTYFSLTAKDFYDNSALNTFNATVNGTFYNTTNGTIQTTINQTWGALVNITLNAPNYFANYSINHNSSTNKTMYPHQVEVRPYAKIAVSEMIVSGFTYNISTLILDTNSNTTFYLKAGTYTINQYGLTSYYNNTKTATYTALQNTTEYFYNTTSEYMNLSVNDIYNGTPVTTFNYTIEANDHAYTFTATTTNGTSYMIPLGSNLWDTSFNITTTANNYFSNTTTYTTNSTGYPKTTNLTQYNTPHTLIRATDYLSGANITSFSVNYTDRANSSNTGVATTATGIVYAPLYNANYTLFTVATGYSTGYANVTAAPYLASYNFSLFGNPSSIFATIYDENTGLLVNTTTVTMTTSSLTGDWSNSTSNGTVFIGNLTPDNYTVKFTSTAYSTRTQTANLGYLSNILMTVYLANTTSTTVFTVRDADSSSFLEGAICTMERSINGTFTTIDSKFADIAGNAQFSYVSGARYRFTCTMTGYTGSQFILDPVLSSSYSVLLSRSTVLSSTADYSTVSISFSPKTFYTGQNNMTFLFSSPTNTFTSYGFVVAYPGGSNTSSGTNSLGETLLTSFAIPGTATDYDTVNITVYYESTVSGGNKSFSYLYYIVSNSTGFGTFFSNVNERYGLGDFELALIATILTIMVAGGAAYYGGATVGGAVMLLFLGYFAYLGFFPLWSILISMLVGVVVITWRTSS